MTGKDKSPTRAEPAEVAVSTPEASAFAAPQWARDVGRWSWIVVGALLVLLALFWATAAIQMVVLASLFAVLFGGTFLPVVDWLHKHRLPRWLGALLVLVFLICLGIFIALVILYGLVKQLPVIQDNLQAAVDSINEKLASTSVDQSTLDSMKTAIEGVLKYATTGAAGTVADVAAGLASLIFGVFISINILVWALIQGRKIATWASHHVPPVHSRSPTRSSPTARASSAATSSAARSSACSTRRSSSSERSSSACRCRGLWRSSPG